MARSRPTIIATDENAPRKGMVEIVEGGADCAPFFAVLRHSGKTEVARVCLDRSLSMQRGAPQKAMKIGENPPGGCGLSIGLSAGWFRSR